MEQTDKDLYPIASLCGIYIWEYQGLTITYDPEYQIIDVDEEPLSKEETMDLLQSVDLKIPHDESPIRVADVFTKESPF